MILAQKQICIAVLTHCQMNENPCSNHRLFEHGFKLENILNETLSVIKKALRTRLMISQMFLLTKMLRTFMTL